MNRQLNFPNECFTNVGGNASMTMIFLPFFLVVDFLGAFTCDALYTRE